MTFLGSITSLFSYALKCDRNVSVGTRPMRIVYKQTLRSLHILSILQTDACYWYLLKMVAQCMPHDLVSALKNKLTSFVFSSVLIALSTISRPIDRSASTSAKSLLISGGGGLSTWRSLSWKSLAVIGCDWRWWAELITLIKGWSSSESESLGSSESDTSSESLTLALGGDDNCRICRTLK